MNSTQPDVGLTPDYGVKELLRIEGKLVTESNQDDAYWGHHIAPARIDLVRVVLPHKNFPEF